MTAIDTPLERCILVAESFVQSTGGEPLATQVIAAARAELAELKEAKRVLEKLRHTLQFVQTCNTCSALISFANTPYYGQKEHPEGYDGPCACDLCMSYAAEDGIEEATL